MDTCITMSPHSQNVTLYVKANSHNTLLQIANKNKKCDELIIWKI